MKVIVISSNLGEVHGAIRVPDDFQDGQVQEVNDRAEYYCQKAALLDVTDSATDLSDAVEFLKGLNGDDTEEEEEVEDE